MRISFRHALARARDWQDRGELGEVSEWWRNGGAGICALAGIGGAGKTAIVDRFLQLVPGVFPSQKSGPTLPAPSHLLIFSFAEGNADEFFDQVELLLRGRGPDPGQVTSYQSVLDLLRNSDTEAGQRLLIVLDGVESVQDDGRRGGKFGQIVDGRLRDLVLRVADGWVPNVSLLVTSRFRLFDPLAQRSLHYSQIAVESLDEHAAVELLRSRGVKGTDSDLRTLAREQHYHALSLDLTGGYIGLFCGGDPNRVPAAHELPSEDPDEDPGIAALREQERRFTEIALWYRSALAERDPAALALLERVCLFRLGVDAATLAAVFTGEGKDAVSGRQLAALNETEIDRKLKQLAHWRLLETSRDVPAGPGAAARKPRYYAHAAVRDGILRQVDEQAVRNGHEAARKELEGILSARPEDQPLAAFRLDLIEEIIHHAIKAGELKVAMELYHRRLGFGRLGHRSGAGDLERGRRICESLVGPLVFPEIQLLDQISHSDLTRTLGEWAAFCLELGRLDECVRIRRLQLDARIPAKPGDDSPLRRSAEGHAYLGQALLCQGRIGEAIRNLEQGFQIAYRLGDASAGKKVYGFLGHAYGLLGKTKDTDAAFEQSRYLQNLEEYDYPLSRPGEFDAQPLYSLGGILLTAYQVRCGLFEEASRNARFNIRQMDQMNPDSAMIPRIVLVLAAVAMHQGEFALAHELCRKAYEWALARDAYEVLCWSRLTKAQIGSHEVESQAAEVERVDVPADSRRNVALAAARTAAQEGIHIARQCGFGIYHIDLMLERARLYLLAGDPASALADIRIAIDDGIRPLPESGRPVLLAATEADCGYAWGIADGRHLRGEALLLEAAQILGSREFNAAALYRGSPHVSRRVESARTELEESKSLRHRIADPRIAETEQVIADLDRGLLTHHPLVPVISEPQRSFSDPWEGERYDVFLSHNSRDKAAVRDLAQALKARGISVWMDETELIAGRPWQAAIEQLIQVVKSVAVLVGPEGLGPWQTQEVWASLSEFVRRGLPVIPVALPGAPSPASLPLFLQQLTWLDLREGMSPNRLAKLEQAINARDQATPA